MVVIPPIKKFTDRRGNPGELVLLRGTSPAQVMRAPGSVMKEDVAGTARPGSVGLIICIEESYKQFTYVLWSNPCVAGWISDGLLRRV